MRKLLLPPKLLVVAAGICGIFLCLAINSVTASAADKLTPCDLEQMLSEIIYPEDGYELQAAVLRNELRNRMLKQANNYQELSDEAEDEFLDEYAKRSVSTLARDGSLRSGKRNLATLARSGFLRPQEYPKRSLATLAKNGQLPSKEPETEDGGPTEDGWVDQKRTLASLARSGYVNGKRNVQSLARKYDLPNGKRSITSMMRNGLYPQYETSPKRNLQSLARANLVFPVYGKKNVGKLARDWLLPNQQKSPTEKRETRDPEEEKRNLASLKNSPVHGSTPPSNKQKREVSYSIMDETNPELAESNYQSDYDELAQVMDEILKLPEEKRYLGSVLRSGFRPYSTHKRYIGALARMGMLRPESADSWYGRRPEKRHIGALARSGWMPSAFRPVHGGRFSRSGRARPDFTPHSTDSTRHQSSWAFVDDALPDTQTPYTGIHLAQHGAQHRPELPLYTGENFDLNPFYPPPPEDFNKHDIMFDLEKINASAADQIEDHQQMQCYQRLKSLYAIIFTDNDMAHNQLFDDEMKK